MGQYVPGTSYIHRLDPRTKIILAGLLMVVFFLVHSLWLLLLLGLLVFSLGLLADIPLGYLLKGLRLIWLLAFITFVFNVFLTPGQPVWTWYFLSATQEGLTRGGAMAMRLFWLVIVTSILSLTTSPIMLTDALEKLLSPFRHIGLPAHELAMVVTIALRFVPTLAKETDRIMKAQMARGAALDRGGLLTRARALIPVLVPLFVCSFRHAEDLALAMEARCYNGGEGRTRLRELRFGNADAVASLVSLAVLTAFVALDWRLRLG